MRLSVFAAEKPLPQLIIDLQKLYAGYLSEQQLSEQALTTELLDDNNCYYVTMFNARHIGAVKVQQQAEKALLSRLCIRDITRRRGVGKNLLTQVETLLASQGVKEISYNLQEVSEDELLSTQAFLVDSHYKIDATNAYKQL